MQYRWCTGKRGSGSAPDWPRGDPSPRGLVVVMADAIASTVVLVLLYLGWLWFLVGVQQNKLDRRRYHDPPTGGAWVRPRPLYGEDLPH